MKNKWTLGAVISVGATALLCTSRAQAQPTDAPVTPVAQPAPPAPPPPAPPPAPPYPAAGDSATAPAPPADRSDWHPNDGPRANEEGPVDIQPGPHTEDERDDAPGAPYHPHEGGFRPRIEPFASIVGGAKGDTLINVSATHGSGQVDAIMIADFGLRGQITPWASFESEIMANGGPDLAGSSVYEGEAALQVRKQVLHLAQDWWMIEVGRVLDEASVDYISSHVVDTFLEDTATRDALLFDGLNLGNGIRGTAEVLPGLRLGMAANAGNVTSTSSILAFGGEYAPYSRIFYQAAGGSREDINGYPTASFGSYVFSPSLLYKKQFARDFGLETHGELQYFLVDPNLANNDTHYLRGYNLKGNIAAHIMKNNVIQPFFNFSYGKNDVVDPNDKTKISSGKYTGISVGGGVDLNYQKKFGNYNGIGFSVMNDQSKTGDSTVPIFTYWNVGTTYWLSKNIALGARFSLWHYNEKTQQDAGERTLLLTARVVL